jgi:hypothetical protein
MTEAQFLALPEVKPYLEYVDGVVLQKPVPKTVHGRLQAELARLLGNYASAVGAGSVATEARTALGPAEATACPICRIGSPDAHPAMTRSRRLRSRYVLRARRLVTCETSAAAIERAGSMPAGSSIQIPARLRCSKASQAYL